MHMRIGAVLVAAACIPTAVLPAQAARRSTAAIQVVPTRADAARGTSTSLGIRVSTLGIGVELSQLLGGHFGVRVGGNYFTIDRQATQEDITYDVTAKLQSFSGILDWYPSRRGSFHLSGGAISRPVKATGVGVPENGLYTINGRDYTSAQIGTYTGSVEYASVLPYAGFGFGTPAAKSRGVGIAFDIGAAIGKPTVRLNSTNENTTPGLAADMRAENAKVQETANKIPVYPVVSLGLTLRF